MVSLPVHHCCVRAAVGTERMPAFSMMVRKPDDGVPVMADRIRAASSSYVTADEEIAAQQAEARKRVEDLRDGLDRLKSGDGDSKDDMPLDQEERREQRSKHSRPPTGDGQGGVTDEEREE